MPRAYRTKVSDLTEPLTLAEHNRILLDEVAKQRERIAELDATVLRNTILRKQVELLDDYNQTLCARIAALEVVVNKARSLQLVELFDVFAAFDSFANPSLCATCGARGGWHKNDVHHAIRDELADKPASTRKAGQE